MEGIPADELAMRELNGDTPKPHLLDAAIAMWVRVFLHVGVTTSLSCSGHYHDLASIEFASAYDQTFASWMLIDAGLGTQFFSSRRNAICVDPRDLLSEAHFKAASSLFARRDELVELRKSIAQRVEELEFKHHEPIHERARLELLENELALLQSTLWHVSRQNGA